MTRIRISIAVLLAGALSACAGLNITPIGTSSQLDKTAHGFRYYQPSSYLFVHSAGKGGLVRRSCKPDQAPALHHAENVRVAVRILRLE